jgi:predicted ATPase/class 3 adenylate cyclase
MAAETPSGTVTFVFTDVEGSTRLWQNHPHAMAAALARHDEIVRGAIERHDGDVFSTAGDAFAAAFASATDAVAAMATAQGDLSNEPWGHAVIRVRAGMHTGEAEERGGDYFGPVVNRAARIMALAGGNQLVLSQATAELVRDQLPPGFELRDVGEHRLKSLHRPEHLFQLMGPGLSVQTVEGAPAEPSGNLPAGVVDFIGRRHDLEELRAAVEPGRVVTLTGIGGAGKTQLATHVAATLADAYADGVWWCDLTPLRSPEMIPSAVAAALGFAMQPDMTPSQSVVDALARRRIVLVLDNCEHLLDGVAGIVDAIVAQCAGVAVVATSREALGTSVEQVWPVQPLDTETDAVDLLVQRAVAADATIDPEQWDRADLVELCARLDGIPLAIEMAAARLRSMGPRQVLDRLDDRFRVLRSRRRGGSERHQTLLATLDWSYDLLDLPEQVLLDRLGVFAGTFDVGIAEAVCADEEVDALDMAELLDRLVDRSLVVPIRGRSGSRFRLLETVRHYGVTHLEEAGQLEFLRRRHAIALADLLEQASVEEMDHRFWDGHRKLVDNWTDAVAAISWCTSVGESELLGRLLRSYGSHGTSVPRPELTELARASLDLSDPPPVAFGFLSYFADGRQQIEYAEAGLARQPPHAGERCLLFSQLSAGRASTGSRGTLAAMRGALDASYELGNRPTIAYWEGIFAETLVRWDPDAAADHAARAWAALEVGRDLPLASQALGKLAVYEAILGRLDDAEELSEEAFRLAVEAGYTVFSANATVTSARIAAVRTPGDAAPVLAHALESARATRWWFNVWPVLSGTGRWFVSTGNERAGAVVDGYFEARGRSRDVDDLQPAPASDPTTYLDDRRAGAAMSADDIVDYVLDELRSPPSTATKQL